MNSMRRLHGAVLALCVSCIVAKKQPNIVLIVSDDLGFNDVGFHGSKQIPTPNIDELAATGITLNHYHVQPVCSPTRATIMAGRNAIHHGIYMPFAQGTALRLDLNFTLMPKYLKALNYSTHMVGKWHLGQNVLAALPTGRGFDSYFGYWSGAEDYYSHVCRGAYDLAEGTRTAFEWNGTYSTPLWTAKAIEVIEKADSSQPFFLYLAYQNIHWPLEAPQEYIDMFEGKTAGNKQRQAICAMTSIMDEGIGNLTAALKRRGLWEDTLVVFSTDNGGPTNGNEGTQSNNYPMRGGKNTLWEGGTRGVAAVRGAGIPQSLQGTVSYHKVHAADWMHTFVRVAAGDPEWLGRYNDAHKEQPYELGDGIDIWDTLSAGREVRTEVIHEAHPASDPQEHGNALTVGDWKILMFGPTHPKMETGWHPPPGQEPNSTSYQLGCQLSEQPSEVDYTECTQQFCLFNVTADPCEYHNLADQFPAVVQMMVGRLAEYQATAVPPVAPQGCTPVITDGAWRPCDAPDPKGI